MDRKIEVVNISLRDSGDFPPQVLALGIFDGLHLGHQSVLKKALGLAKKLKLPAGVLTLDPHPRSIKADSSPVKLLTTLDERAYWLEELGIAALYVLPFDELIARLEPEPFVAEFLAKKLKARAVVAGEDYRFGWKCHGDIQVLSGLGAKYGFSVSAVPLYRQNQEIVSSSRIREFLPAGKFAQALVWLGHPYLIRGRATKGAGRGRRLGYPTINLTVPPAKILPSFGVYGGEAVLDGRKHRALIHLGPVPTFERQQPTLEVHLIDVQVGEVAAGQELDILVNRFIRPISKFSGPDELRAHIAQDKKSIVNSDQ